MIRDIITIDEDKCDGCGACVPDCPEGALQIIDGKARLVSDLFCDGLGACISGCPRGALTVERREAGTYDENRVMENIARQGQNVIDAHLKHLREHGETKLLDTALRFLKDRGLAVPASMVEPAHRHHGCPGSAAMDFRGREGATAHAGPERASELRQWPVQLALVNPAAPYFDGADLLVVADCVPTSYGEFHGKLLRGSSVVMFCPKLDRIPEEYVDKMTAIISGNDVRSITVARMDVPCCGGATALVNMALEKSGKSISIREIVVSIRGDIQ